MNTNPKVGQFPALDAAIWHTSTNRADARAPFPEATITDKAERDALVLQTCLRVQFLALSQCSTPSLVVAMQEAMAPLGFTARGSGRGREYLEFRQACGRLADDVDRWLANGLSDEAMGRARLAAVALCFQTAHELMTTQCREGLSDAVAEAMQFASAMPQRLVLK